MAEWRPMSTAPRDGTPILGFCPTAGEDDCIYVIRWSNLLKAAAPYWVEAGGEGFAEYHPVAWMPRPLPPAEAELEALNT